MITAALPAAAALCARFVLGIVFVAAGVSKFRDPAAFAHTVSTIGALPSRHVGPLAIALPVVEVCCGVSMAAGLLTDLVALVIGALTTAFTVVLVTLLARGHAVPCTCFGSMGDRPGRAVSWRSVLRNAGIVACAGIVAGWGTPVLALDALWSPGAAALGGSAALALLIATTSVMLAALITRRLWRLSRPLVTAR